jgi:hypothetical protein
VTPIRVEDTKVVVTLTATTGWTFTFSHDAGHKAWAELLAESLRKTRDDAEAKIWQNAYNQGWADAKAKRPKMTK